MLEFVGSDGQLQDSSQYYSSMNPTMCFRELGNRDLERRIAGSFL